MNKKITPPIDPALRKYLMKTADLGAAQALLSWDQETYMPGAGAVPRARQLSLITGLIHDRITDPELDRLVQDLENISLKQGASREQKALARLTRRRIDRAKKVPKDLVTQLAEESAKAHHVWVEARNKADFSLFSGQLSVLIELTRQVAEYVGYSDSPYDALLDEYEEGLTSAYLSNIFSELKNGLLPLLERVRKCRQFPNKMQGKLHFPTENQKTFIRRIVETMGFDFNRGRIDTTVHPFCSGFTLQDVRLALRWHEDNILEALSGALHEAGHGLYEQGLPAAYEGTPLAQAVSYGIHESQSRLWENRVGRDRGFSGYIFGLLHEFFSKAMAGITFDDYYRELNRVEPSCIRVGADELTYNFHIIIRFEIEKALFDGDAQTKDLPALWNESMKRCLGICPPNDSQGVLQDVHWSMAAFGYFPTYTLGNLYASQFFQQAEKELSGLHDQLGRGELLPLKEWLNVSIHSQGSLYKPDELIRRVTNKELDISCYLQDMENLYVRLYEGQFS